VHAHNIILQILAESGLIGLILSTGIGILLLRRLIKAWPFTQDNRIEIIGYVGILIAALTHLVVDYAFESPLYIIGIYFVLTRVESLDTQREAYKLPGWLGSSALFLLIAIYSLGSFTLMHGADQQYTGVQAAQEGEWQTAQSQICEAAEVNESQSFHDFQCGLISAVLHTTNPSEETLLRTRQAYEEGLAKDPYWPYHLAASASILWESNQREDALEYLEKAQPLAPRSYVIALNLAWMYDQLGLDATSEEWLGTAFELNPWLWRTVLLSEQTSDQHVPILMKWLDNRYLPRHYAALQGWIYLDQGEYKLAKDSLHESLGFDPATVEAYAGLAQIAIQQGDLKEAAYQLGLADLTGRSSILLDEVRAVYAEVQGDTHLTDSLWIAAARTGLWPMSSGPYFESVYGRSYLPMDLPPQTMLAPLSHAIQTGYLQALDRGGSQLAEALYPWYETQTNRYPEWLETAAFEGLTPNE
jgi:tetratricopeptide (TPR) repeat protein